MRRLHSLSRRSVLLTAACAAGVLALCALAFASPTQPALTVTSPLPGSVVSVWNPGMVVTAADTVAMNSTAAFVIDGGATITVNVAFPSTGGYWVGSGCDAYWVDTYDYTHGTISYTPTMLTNGSHTVKATLADSSGQSNAQTWSFTVQAPPVFSAITPAEGAAVKSTQPTMTVTISDSGTMRSTGLTLDGASVPATFNASTKVLTARPAASIIDGSHTAVVSAIDNTGLGSSSTWHFMTVNTSSTVFSQPKPSANTTVTVWNPTVSVVCTTGRRFPAGRCRSTASRSRPRSSSRLTRTPRPSRASRHRWPMAGTRRR